MKQIQREIQEINTSIEGICIHRLNGEDAISELKDRIVAKDHKQKICLKIAREHEISMK